MLGEIETGQHVGNLARWRLRGAIRRLLLSTHVEEETGLCQSRVGRKSREYLFLYCFLLKIN